MLIALLYLLLYALLAVVVLEIILYIVGIFFGVPLVIRKLLYAIVGILILIYAIQLLAAGPHLRLP